MLLNNKEIAKIADLCRKKGIDSIKITENSVEFKLGEKPTTKTRSAIDGKDPKVENAMTDEEVLFWSTHGVSPEMANG